MKNDKSKMSRKERERLMIEQMDAALSERKFSTTNNKSEKENAITEKSVEKSTVMGGAKNGKEARSKGKVTEGKLHCPRCKSLMENGKCPTCGHYVYVPMDKEKQKKIRLIVSVVCVVAFVVLFVLSQIKK